MSYHPSVTPAITQPRLYYAPNGMNFSRSINNPKSRLHRVFSYLQLNGEATKREIHEDVFGKTVAMHSNNVHQPSNSVYRAQPSNSVSYGWGCYVFTLAIRYGYLRKRRTNGTTMWSAGVFA